MKLGRLYKKERKELLKKVALLDQLSHGICLESRSRMGRYAKEAWRLSNFFFGEIKKYVRIEEKEVFPILERYRPQHGCMLIHFQAEHVALLNGLTQLKRLSRSLMRGLRGVRNNTVIIKYYQNSMYVSHLLRHHLKSEGDYLGKTIYGELTSRERRSVVAQLKGC